VRGLSLRNNNDTSPCNPTDASVDALGSFCPALNNSCVAIGIPVYETVMKTKKRRNQNTTSTHLDLK
jgi:hypothetical protein